VSFREVEGSRSRFNDKSEYAAMEAYPSSGDIKNGERGDDAFRERGGGEVK